MILPAIGGAGLIGGMGGLAWAARRRGLDRWAVPYLLQAPRRLSTQRGGPVHLILCIADHFEPGHANASPERLLN